MKKRSLATLQVVLTLSVALSGLGAWADSIQGNRAASTGQGLEALDEGSKSQIIHLLDSLQIPFTGLKGKEWHRRKGTYVVVVTLTKEDVEESKHEVFAFNISRPKFKVMASPGGLFTFAIDDSVEGFDFAPYQMTSNEFAFGIRYSRHRGYATGDASLKGVLLCRIKASEILEIANIPTSFEADLPGETEEDGSYNRDTPSERAIIQVTKKKTSGYFDWIKKVEEGKSVRLTWNGNGYVLRGTDPFLTKEYEIFDLPR